MSQFVEYVIFVDEEAAAVFGERVFRDSRPWGTLFGLSDADPVVVFVREATGMRKIPLRENTHRAPSSSSCMSRMSA